MRKILFFFIFILLSCNENLPLYDEPNRIVEVTIKPFYSYSQTANRVVINIVAKNIYDETLDDKARIGGELNIVNTKLGKSKKIILDWTMLSRSNGYNRTTGKLVLPPRDSLVFQYIWDLTYDDSSNIKSLLEYKHDPKCQYRKISPKIEQNINGHVTLFSNTPYFYLQNTEFKFCHVDTFVDGRICPLLFPEATCLE
ncbi:MAG: hypothetical protein EXR24_01545 [Ignavibacteria bacterium]|nr:hypothetical protein [Bacteroidota bacterium]MSQ45651.1 hypothetical protein [Ignavibacteria bacterium]